MSNTPLTDMLLISWDMDVPSYVMTRHARFIELKLNAANERIKRLEEAGNNLLWNFCPEYTSDFTESQSDALKQWNKAKEDKP